MVQNSAMLNNQLLKHLNKEDIQTIPKGTVIVDFHTYIKKIPIVVSGSVKVLSEDEDGREIALYHIKPGESCVASILGAMNQTTSNVKAVTIEPTELLILDSSRAYTLIRDDKAWFDFFMKLYQTRFNELLKVVTNVGFKTHEERLLHMLRERSKLLKTQVIEITHQQIADEFGTSREVISRILKKMEGEKLLKLGRGKILLQPNLL